MHIHTNKHRSSHTHTHTRARTHTHTRTHAHAHAHTCTRTYTQTKKQHQTRTYLSPTFIISHKTHICQQNPRWVAAMLITISTRRNRLVTLVISHIMGLKCRAGKWHHIHANTSTYKHKCMFMHISTLASKWHPRTHMHTNARTHTQKSTHAHAYEHAHVHVLKANAGLARYVTSCTHASSHAHTYKHEHAPCTFMCTRIMHQSWLMCCIRTPMMMPPQQQQQQQYQQTDTTTTPAPEEDAPRRYGM